MLTKRFCIKRLYCHRSDYSYDDDTKKKDEYQLEVYMHAQKIMKENNFKAVIDVGCGSAYKLIKYFGEYDTLGIEVSPTYEWLLDKYPERRWMKSNFNIQEKLSADLIVCVDMIEHLVDPDELLEFINRIECKQIVFSTPSRDMLCRFGGRGYFGPPRNSSHMREWSFKEFNKYISKKFDIILHSITNREQTTQMVVCKKKHS